MFLFAFLALTAFIVSASLQKQKWLFLVAVFMAFLAVGAILGELAFPRRSDWEESALVQVVVAGLLFWQREKFRPYLKKWGIITQWGKLKDRIAQQQSENGVQNEPELTGEEHEKDQEFRIKVGERFSELSQDQIVRGVWESVVLRTSTLSGTAIKSDSVEAVNIAIINELLTARSEKKKTFDGAVKNPLQPNANVSRVIEIGKINSIELANTAQFYGDNSQPINTGRKPPYGFKDRHPYAVINGLGNYRQDDATLWIVFAFLNDGERSPLMRTFNYDLAVKWRTQIANLIQNERMKTAQAPIESDGDYL